MKIDGAKEALRFASRFNRATSRHFADLNSGWSPNDLRASASTSRLGMSKDKPSAASKSFTGVASLKKLVVAVLAVLLRLLVAPLKAILALPFVQKLLGLRKKTPTVVVATTAAAATAVTGSSSSKSTTSATTNIFLSPTSSDEDAKKYVEAKLKEIDAKMKATATSQGAVSSVAREEPWRWPPIEPIPAAPTNKKRSVMELSEKELRGKRVLVRCDLNVPIEKGVITDDTRIRGSIPTIKYLQSKGAKVLLASHLGRPKGGYEAKFSLAPIIPRLSELLGFPVELVPDCIGMAVAKCTQEMKEGHVALLENVRFYPEEEKNEKKFAAQLAKNVDLFVNDAFGTAHRAHASTEGVTAFVRPAVAGMLLQKELDYLQGAVDVPKRPFAAIVGGSKVSSKISVIEAMLSKVDKLVLGGGMVFTILKARGIKVGNSLVEDDQLALATKLEKIANDKGVQLFLASDVVVADKFAADAANKIVDVNAIPDGWMGLDIGPKTIADIQAGLSDCKTVIWNGPMGVFEWDAFAKGTNAIATTLAGLTSKGCITIIGGGDSVAAVEKAGLASKMSHISTGGGASLELLEGLVLPGVAALCPPC